MQGFAHLQDPQETDVPPTKLLQMCCTPTNQPENLLCETSLLLQRAEWK